MRRSAIASGGGEIGVRSFRAFLKFYVIKSDAIN
jgi:hypothetical protein